MLALYLNLKVYFVHITVIIHSKYINNNNNVEYFICMAPLLTVYICLS